MDLITFAGRDEKLVPLFRFQTNKIAMSNDKVYVIAVPDELKAQKVALRNGEKPRATVRELLHWFDAARRGLRVVRRIRSALDEVGLVTWPDFEGEYIDQEIFFMDKESFQRPERPVDVDEDDLSGTGPAPAVDPSHRLGRLKAANTSPVSVSPNNSLETATTLMLTNDFSQLPVMQGDRTVKGMISWKSIGSRLALGSNCGTVQDCMEQHYELRDDVSLFDAIEEVAKHDCVLVRDRESRISGLVTGADISEQFQVLAEPFLLLGDIENRIRALILPHFSTQELEDAKSPDDPDRTVEDVSDLTFGEYVRLLENKDRWSKLGLHIDRAEFVKQLGAIRDIRNEVMHFDPDGISDDALADLRRFNGFLERLQQLTC